jgi:hypothetical protein
MAYLLWHLQYLSSFSNLIFEFLGGQNPQGITEGLDFTIALVANACFSKEKKNEKKIVVLGKLYFTCNNSTFFPR